MSTRVRFADLIVLLAFSLGASLCKWGMDRITNAEIRHKILSAIAENFKEIV